MSLKLLLVRSIYWLKGLVENPMKLFKELGVGNNDIILEIGCAIGYHTFPLANIVTSGQVYAVDIWEEGLTYMIGKIRETQNIEIIYCSAEAVELPPSSLDKIICFNTLHEVPNFKYAIEQWMKFLKKGGTFYYRDPIIPPQEILDVAQGKLQKEGTIKNVHIFIRK
ncbi:MAG: class I SAM-dependent methyltransferase [Candidatus Hodarchaeota archaeon]